MLTVTSSAFAAGAAIPKRFTGTGEDLSPPLDIGGVPAGTKELALICDDPDAPRAEPWVHWVLTGLPPSATHFDEGRVPAGAVLGKNDFGRLGYGGPMPPRGHGTHHYHFAIYALDVALGLRPGATRAEVVAAMQGHILARGELVGTFERQ